MIFNSFEFLIFLPIVFVLFWIIKSSNNNTRNFLLLISSYFFYSCWDFRFLFLLIFSTVLDFYFGNQIYKETEVSKKKLWLYTSVGINLMVLGFFKYYNFFALSFKTFLMKFGLETHPVIVNLLLPVGISFYTFHGLSYVFDIYKKQILPEKNIINYSLFVSFFPLLVAGPIERASHLLPQLNKEKIFNYAFASKGVKQILWGLFKKIVIADNCAVYVDQIYNYESTHNGVSLLIASILFAFQIYGDFSGYSDIALGTARLFGIDLIKNFSFPYFSRDIAEFWRRWHISLTSWFRDYVYIPLGGSRLGLKRGIVNTFIIFILSGFWHGANWTFIVWGGLNAIYFLPLLIIKKNRKHIDLIAKDSFLPSLKEFIQVIFTFGLVVLAWVFFRSQNIDVALRILKRILLIQQLNTPIFFPERKIVLLILFMIVVEWIYRKNNFALETNLINNTILRYSFYFVIVFSLFYFGGEVKQFIYFQF